MQTKRLFSMVTALSLFTGANYGAGAAITVKCTIEETLTAAAESALKNAVVKAKAQLKTTDLNSTVARRTIQEAATFYGGQNILNAADANFAELFNADKVSIEILRGLYLALQEFRTEDGSGFDPDCYGLDTELSRANFHFLQAVFEAED